MLLALRASNFNMQWFNKVNIIANTRLTKKRAYMSYGSAILVYIGYTHCGEPIWWLYGLQ